MNNVYAAFFISDGPVSAVDGGKAAKTLSIYRLETVMKWSKPQATEMRFGFEITMYINNR